MQARPLVIYHAGCFDGFCAAWLFHRAFPDSEFVAATYGREPPNVAGRFVYVVDFSYPRGTIRDMAKAATALVVLDHHKTAQAELAGLQDEIGGECIIRFDMNKSGGHLSFDYLAEFCLGFKDRPWLVDYTEDRDLWRHKLPYTKEVNACLRSHPFDFVLWDQFAEFETAPPATFIREGIAILRAERQLVETHVRHACEIELAGHRVLAVNATMLQSEIAGELAAGRPFGVVYFDTDKERIWSLRSRDGVDVSVIAKANGGGGHRNAAGFSTPLK